MNQLVLGLYGLSKNQKNISGYSVINDNETPLSQFVLNPDFALNNSLNKF